MADKYKIVRYFYKSERCTIVARNLTLEEAQAWCKDPDTSSKTATSRNAKQRTARYGAWFDGYDLQ